MSPSDKIFGLLGYPIKHSFSPIMHNAAFRKLGISAEYRLFEKNPEELNSFLKNMNSQNIFGLNVTIPYKDQVLDFIKLGPDQSYLRNIGAVNTIVKINSEFFGFNTDITGFQKHLSEQISPLGKSVALLGAGGAARAISYTLAKAGVEKISIFDIDKEKAKSVALMLGGIFSDFDILDVNSIDELDIRNKDILINATPVGLKESDPCLIDSSLLHKDLFVYDLIYNPSKTRLLHQAQEKGAKTSNGLGMLVYQGALSFMHFSGIDIPFEDIAGIMKKALREELGKIC